MSKEFEECINQLGRFFWQDDDRRVNTDCYDIIISCLYVLLTTHGTTKKDEILKFDKSYNSIIDKLISFSRKSEKSYFKNPVYKSLELKHIPRYKSEILEALSSSDILEKYLVPLFSIESMNDEIRKRLIIICIILCTFNYRYLGAIPLIDDDLLISFVKDLDGYLVKSKEKNDILELSELYYLSVCFFDSTLDYIDYQRKALQCFSDMFEMSPDCEVHLFSTLLKRDTVEFLIDYCKGNYDEALYELIIETFIILLQLICSLTSSSKRSEIICQKLENVEYSRYIMKSLMELLNDTRYERRSQSLFTIIDENFKFHKEQSCYKFDRNIRELLGIDSEYVNMYYFIDMLSSNVYIPRMIQTYNDLEIYLISTILLFKQNFYIEIFEDIVTNFENKCLINVENINIGQSVSSFESSKIFIDQGSKGGMLLKISDNEILDFLFFSINKNGIRILDEEMKKYRVSFSFASIPPENVKDFKHCYIFSTKNASVNIMKVALEMLYDADSYKKSKLCCLWMGPTGIDRNIYDAVNLNAITITPSFLRFGHMLHDNDSHRRVLETAIKNYKTIRLDSVDYEFKEEDNKKVVVLDVVSGKQRRQFKIYLYYPVDHFLDDKILLTSEQFLSVLSSIFKNITIIQGPPGTGKTETVVAITKMITKNFYVIGNTFVKDNDKKRERVLISAHSNKALDQMIEALVNCKVKVLRYGKQTTSLIVKKTTLEGYRLLYFHEICRFVSKIEDKESNTEISRIFSISNANYNTLDSYIEKSESAIRLLKSKYESKLTSIIQKIDLILKPQVLEEHILSECPVVAATISSCMLQVNRLKKLNTKTIIIEEAAKVLETEMLSFIKIDPERIVLIGDHEQLKPLVKCDDVRINGRFNISFFERMQNIGIQPIQLTSQGRARKEIADLYRWRYSVELNDLYSVSNLKIHHPIDCAVQWINVVKTTKEETRETNLDECAAIIETLKMFNKNNIKLNLVSVISPYKNQKDLLSSEIEKERLIVKNVNTVDEFQGLQNDIILVSLVSQRPSLFLRDNKRINVLTSRSRTTIMIFGNASGFEDVYEWKNIVKAVNKVRKAGPLYFDGKIYKFSNKKFET